MDCFLKEIFEFWLMLSLQQGYRYTSTFRLKEQLDLPSWTSTCVWVIQKGHFQHGMAQSQGHMKWRIVRNRQFLRPKPQATTHNPSESRTMSGQRQRPAINEPNKSGGMHTPNTHWTANVSLLSSGCLCRCQRVVYLMCISSYWRPHLSIGMDISRCPHLKPTTCYVPSPSLLLVFFYYFRQVSAAMARDKWQSLVQEAWPKSQHANKSFMALFQWQCITWPCLGSIC